MRSRTDVLDGLGGPSNCRRRSGSGLPHCKILHWNRPDCGDPAGAKTILGCMPNPPAHQVWITEGDTGDEFLDVDVPHDGHLRSRRSECGTACASARHSCCTRRRTFPPGSCRAARTSRRRSSCPRDHVCCGTREVAPSPGSFPLTLPALVRWQGCLPRCPMLLVLRQSTSKFPCGHDLRFLCASGEGEAWNPL